MQKIDRLGWAGGICVQSYGWRIGVRLSRMDDPIVERDSTCLPPASEPSEPPFVDMLFSLRIGGDSGRLRNYHLLYAPLRQAARTMELDEIFETLQNEIR